MATLILGAFGSIFGGPIGRAVGAIIGNQIDNRLFAPAARQGPRLSDLSVQTSTYGAPIPKLFGRTRVSGTVIWSTDLIETTQHQSNGKGRGSTDSYSYSASFAVLLSARPVARIGRIWADGKLLRGEAGDLKVAGTMRFYSGSEDQAVDPLIASAEGASAPAYRGSAYAVFEGLQLGDYGNRIPSLSFEVIADEGSVAIGTMLAGLAAGGAGTAVAAEVGPGVIGFAATGTTVRAVIDTLSPAFAMSCRNTAGAAITFAPPPTVPIDDDLGASAKAGDHGRRTIDIAPLDTVASAITLAYFDQARDYQPGLQRARREGPGRREERIDLPTTIDASAAHGLAEEALARRARERTTATITLPWRALALRPGDWVESAGADWRIGELRFEGMTLSLSVVRSAVLPTIVLAADAGRAIHEQDVASGPTTLITIDMPALGDTPAAKPVVAVFANGGATGWRRADLLASIDGGATYAVAGTTAIPAVIGTLATPLSAGSPFVIDRANMCEVVLLNPAQALANADAAALLGGANTAIIGDEIVQFGSAVAVSPGRWRLSELWRGRRASEDAVVVHGIGTRFVMLVPATAAVLVDPLTRPGVIVLASGVGDSAPYPTSTSSTASRAIVPLSPVLLTATRNGGGDTVLRWTRRSRDGWLWRDGVDAPIAEEAERYRVIRTAGSASGSDEVTVPTFLYTAAARASDVAAGATTAAFSIVQVGAAAISTPAKITIALN